MASSVVETRAEDQRKAVERGRQRKRGSERESEKERKREREKERERERERERETYCARAVRNRIGGQAGLGRMKTNTPAAVVNRNRQWHSGSEPNSFTCFACLFNDQTCEKTGLHSRHLIPTCIFIFLDTLLDRGHPSGHLHCQRVNNCGQN